MYKCLQPAKKCKICDWDSSAAGSTAACAAACAALPTVMTMVGVKVLLVQDSALYSLGAPQNLFIPLTLQTADSRQRTARQTALHSNLRTAWLRARPLTLRARAQLRPDYLARLGWAVRWHSRLHSFHRQPGPQPLQHMLGPHHCTAALLLRHYIEGQNVTKVDQIQKV